MKQGQHVPVGNDLSPDQDSLETGLYDPDVKRVVLRSWQTVRRVAARVWRDVLVAHGDGDGVKVVAELYLQLLQLACNRNTAKLSSSILRKP